jgi:hypothetical protein
VRIFIITDWSVYEKWWKIIVGTPEEAAKIKKQFTGKIFEGKCYK